MAHIQTTILKLWKPQYLNLDKISSQKMFIDNIDELEAFGLSVLKNINAPVSTISELKAIDTSNTSLFTDCKVIMVKSKGLYYFDRGSTETDNDDTIIAPTNGGGRWKSEKLFFGGLALKDSLSKSDVGLGNVPNVTTNDQTPTYTQSSSLINLVSGEKISISLGKVMKAIADLISHLANKSNPHGVTASQVGLGNVDNTSDMDKPVSTAQALAIQQASQSGSEIQQNLNTHLANKSNPHDVTASQVGLGNVPNVATNDQTPTYTQATSLSTLTSGEKLSVSMGKIMKAITDLISHLANKSNPHDVTASQVGLGNVNNTADSDKPVSTAQQVALDGKVPTTRKVNNKALSADITLSATDVGAIPVAFTSTSTSTTDDDLDNIINNAFNAMADNTTRIIKVNFSMQHEFFVSGTSAIITIYRSASNYGCLMAVTLNGYPEVFTRSRYGTTSWGNWINKSSAVSSAIVE